MAHYVFMLDDNATVNAGLEPKNGFRILGRYAVNDLADLIKLINLLQSTVDTTVLYNEEK